MTVKRVSPSCRQIFLVLLFSFSCFAASDEDKDFTDTEDDSLADESYPLEVLAPLPPPPYRPRPVRPPAQPAYGTSSSYHEQDNRGYGAYRFGYKVEDPYTGNYQTRDEEKNDDGAVRGSYSVVEPDGNVRTVYYIADKFGFRAFVKNSHKPSSSHGLPPPF